MSYGPKQTLQEGYEKFVIKNAESCWDWKGCAPKNPGYGQFRYGMKRERAHRASWIIHFGEIPKGMWVLHKCDNYRCSRPDHLFLGTTKDNVKDMISKQRHPYFGKKGETNHKSILTTHQVLLIKNLISKPHVVKDIAKQFGVAPQTICNIKSNLTWKGLQ